MRTLAKGARRLPTQHLTIRVPWQDTAWDGRVCRDPLANTSCLVLPRIGQSRNDDVERDCAGQRVDSLDPARWPPCVAERATFMAPFDLIRAVEHPYKASSPDTHGHFDETPLPLPKYAAQAVPFRWMLRETIEGSDRAGERGLADLLEIGFQPDREPKLPFSTAWIQEKGNQLAVLDTFFGAVTPGDSLCFFYAKRTPLSEQSRRVIVGVGRVLSVGEPVEYVTRQKSPPLRCVLWERSIGHSIRP